MTFLIIGAERYVLQLGETILGGHDDELLRESTLGALPPFAVLTAGGDATLVRALPSPLSVVVTGDPLGAAERTLRHGDWIAAGGVTIHVGDLDKAGRTDRVPGIADADLRSRAALAITDPTAPTGGRLVRLADGTAFAIPDAGLTIGRDPDCGVVVASRAASRRHARIVPGLLGYSLVDESANGVTLNHARLESSALLSQGDVIGIGSDTFRFSADLASYEPDAAVFASPAVPLRAAEPVSPQDAAAPTDSFSLTARPPESTPAPVTLLATLEVLNGSLPVGTRFRVERPVVQLGRGAQNDVRLADDSVSGSHATLLLRGATWHLLDLGSRNGTYVEGQRVNECVLQGVCELRLGTVSLLFRPIRSAAPADNVGTLGVFGLTDADLRTR